MSKSQHGFLHGRSCLTNLFNASEQWTRALDKRAGVDVIYFDFEKAFDCGLSSKDATQVHSCYELGPAGLGTRTNSFLALHK